MAEGNIIIKTELKKSESGIKAKMLSGLRKIKMWMNCIIQKICKEIINNNNIFPNILLGNIMIIMKYLLLELIINYRTKNLAKIINKFL
jgi:hypothetical protein